MQQRDGDGWVLDSPRILLGKGLQNLYLVPLKLIRYLTLPFCLQREEVARGSKGAWLQVGRVVEHPMYQRVEVC